MNRSLARDVAMVRARHFAANPETMASNAFQSSQTDKDAAVRAMEEQEALAHALLSAGIRVNWFEPPEDSRSPDGVFPNNWFSTHADGKLVLYPMEALSRRTERIVSLASQLRDNGYSISETIDYSHHEKAGEFLEGTGSLVLDRDKRVAWLSPSSRTSKALARRWAHDMGYQLQMFTSCDPSGKPVYHTNVVMALGAGLAILCIDSVRDSREREAIRAALAEYGHRLLEISWEQVCHFAGNQLFLQGRAGPVVVLSAAAETCLENSQLAVIDAHAERIRADIATIERHGGGSVRCMLAEIFLPRLL